MTAASSIVQGIVYAPGTAARADLDAVLSGAGRRCSGLFCGGAAGLAGQVGSDQHGPRGAAVLPGRRRASDSAVPARWVRFFSLPGGWGLSSSGAFLFARLFLKSVACMILQPVHVIHAHSALPCGHAASLLSRELKIPFVVTVHGLDAFSTRQVGGHAGEWCARVSRSVYRSACSVICVSEKVREQVIEGAGTAGEHHRSCTTGSIRKCFLLRTASRKRATDPQRWQSHSDQRARVAVAGLCRHSKPISRDFRSKLLATGRSALVCSNSPRTGNRSQSSFSWTPEPPPGCRRDAARHRFCLAQPV